MPVWTEGVPIRGSAKSDEATEMIPTWFVWRNVRHNVEFVSEHWRVHTNWWVDGGEVWRHYWQVATDSGFLVEIYRDMVSERWYLERVYGCTSERASP